MPELTHTRLGVLPIAVAAFLAGCGGGHETRSDAGAPSEAATPAATAAPAVHHAELKTVESDVQSALQGTGAAGAPTQPGGAAPNFTEVFAGAGKLAKGADDILKDQPASLTDEDRVRYEGLVAQLKQRAADLQAAAEQQQAFQAKRSFTQLTASCVRCHSQFGAGEGK